MVLFLGKEFKKHEKQGRNVLFIRFFLKIVTCMEEIQPTFNNLFSGN